MGEFSIHKSRMSLEESFKENELKLKQISLDNEDAFSMGAEISIMDEVDADPLMRGTSIIRLKRRVRRKTRRASRASTRSYLSRVSDEEDSKKSKYSPSVKEIHAQTSFRRRKKSRAMCRKKIRASINRLNR